MAVFATETYKAQDPRRSNTSRVLAANVVSGDMQFAVIPYTLSTELSGDVINLCLLPAGVIPVPQLSKVTASGEVDNSPEISIGTVANNSGWCNGLALASNTEYWCNSGAEISDWTAPTPLLPDLDSGVATVFVTITSSDGASPGTTLTFLLAYKIGR